MLSKEDMAAIMATEEKRLGVGSREFMERHKEIMVLADRLRQEIRNASAGTTNTDKGK